MVSWPFVKTEPRVFSYDTLVVHPCLVGMLPSAPTIPICNVLIQQAGSEGQGLTSWPLSSSMMSSSARSSWQKSEHFSVTAK